MLRIAIASDIHYTRGDTLELPNTEDASVLVLAGDIINLNIPGASEHHKEFLSDVVNDYETVIMVPGNHEYYGNSYEAAGARLENFCEEIGVTLLDPGVYEHPSGVRFVGATLWTDFNAYDQEAVDAYHQNISDSHMIFRFDAEKQKSINDVERQFLFDTVELGDIVITHHTPSMLSGHEKWGTSPTNYSFHNTYLTDFIEDKKPAYWIHGHTHDPCGYTIGDTQVICNPRGYYSERSPGWAPVIIDV